MYTIVSMTAASDSKPRAEKAVNTAFKELDRLAGLLNFYSESSEIAAVNRSAGIVPVKVSPETLEVVERALYIAEQTDGAFDITVGPLVKLWNIQKRIVPTDREIKDKLKLVGYKHVIINKKNSTIYLDRKGMQIDLGGIIKGYAADKVVAILKSAGITAGIIAVGGEVKAFGKRPDGNLWDIGIQNPRQKGTDDEILATIRFTDKGISTSGGYEKFFIKDGKRYHHILDPKTGYPADRCLSVSVIADRAPDGFPTGLFVLGPQKAPAILKRLHMDGIIVDNNGRVFITEGIKDKVEFTNGGLAQ